MLPRVYILYEQPHGGAENSESLSKQVTNFAYTSRRKIAGCKYKKNILDASTLHNQSFQVSVRSLVKFNLFSYLPVQLTTTQHLQNGNLSTFCAVSRTVKFRAEYGHFTSSMSGTSLTAGDVW